MSVKKYYAVRKGREKGIFTEWKDCEKSIKGYSGADYKSFKSLEEAENFLNEEESSLKDKNKINDDQLSLEKKIANHNKEGYVVAFTDGSYKKIDDKDLYSYGIYIITPDGESEPSRTEEVSAQVTTPKFEGSNNMVGEVFGVINALEWCLKNNYNKVAIYCDYEGLYYWARKEWRAKSEIAKFYVNKIAEYAVLLDIDFIWVKGHSNISGNERADELAKDALKGKQKFKSGDNFFTGEVGGLDELEDYIEFLRTEVPEIKTSTQQVNHGHGLKTTIDWKNDKENERLHVTYFENTNTMLVQGKPGYLFTTLLSLYTEDLEAWNMVYLYSRAYESTIKFDKVEAKFKELNLPSDYPKEFKILIKQAISILYAKDIQEYDYGHYTIPAYRALEGHLRYLLKKSGVDVPQKFSIGCHFKKNKKTGEHELQTKKLVTGPYSEKIEKSYKIYFNHRHSQTHTGAIGLINQTELIPTLKEAKERIREVLCLLQFP